MVRVVQRDDIERSVKDLCVRANNELRPDVLKALKRVSDSRENSAMSKKMLSILLENAEIAKKTQQPICQDTGMVAVFIEMGSDVHVEGGNIAEAVNNGVRDAYEEACFRKSVVADPIMRENTGTNTPAVIHIDPVDGSSVKISVMPKGFGSENKSRTAMLNPTCSFEDIVDFCVETVKIAGPDACPPYILGVGLGGTMEGCALLAKKALLQPVGGSNPKQHIADLEREIEKKVNELKIGVMGLGGPGTVLGVNILEGPTHIAGMPVAVNLSCHALRSASTVIWSELLRSGAKNENRQ